MKQTAAGMPAAFCCLNRILSPALLTNADKSWIIVTIDSIFAQKGRGVFWPFIIACYLMWTALCWISMRRRTAHCGIRWRIFPCQTPRMPSPSTMTSTMRCGRRWSRGRYWQDKLVIQRFEKLLAAFGVQGNPVEINDYYLTQLSQRADTFPGAEEALEELAEVATLAVVSNGVEKVQAGRLEKSGLGRFFDGVFVSGRVGATKPARKIFDTALNTLGIENRKKVLMIGDSLKADIAGGTGAGIDTCWCNFRGAVLPEGAPQPTYTIQGYEELLRIVMEEEELANAGSKEKRHQL